MTGVVMCCATFKTKTEAKKVCKTLVNEGLIACANIMAPMQSIYRWQKKLETTKEVPVFLKTTVKKVSMLKKRFAELHSYDVPCLMIMDVKDGLADYLKWVSKI